MNLRGFLLVAAAAAIGMAAFLVASPGRVAEAEVSHCPDGGVKIEGNASELNEVVLVEGTSFCVKAGPGNTGIRVADGAKTLCDYLIEAGIEGGNSGTCKDVSYYRVYSTPTPTPTPTSTPTITPTPTPIVTPTPIITPTPTSIVTPTGEPTPAPTFAPSSTPTVTPPLTLTPTPRPTAPTDITPVGTSETQQPVSLPVTGGAPVCEDEYIGPIRLDRQALLMYLFVGMAVGILMGAALARMRER